jgi:hypothetical protein
MNKQFWNIKRKWYNYILRNKLQNVILVYTALAITASFSIVYFLFFKHITHIRDLILGVDRGSRDELLQFITDPSFGQTMALTLISLMIVFTLLTVFLSHKFVGPMIHLKRHFDRLTENKSYEPVSFRKHDYFKDVAESINKYLDTIKR